MLCEPAGGHQQQARDGPAYGRCECPGPPRQVLGDGHEAAPLAQQQVVQGIKQQAKGLRGQGAHEAGHDGPEQQALPLRYAKQPLKEESPGKPVGR